jgi:hypothetical protein
MLIARTRDGSSVAAPDPAGSVLKESSFMLARE